MSEPLLPPESVRRIAGFGGFQAADGFVIRAGTREDVHFAFESARKCKRQVVLRGSGLSYGDAAIGQECIVLDLSPMNKVLEFDADSGVISAETGVTIQSLAKTVLPMGWWVPVVSGTANVTLGGALAMNIHGKNHFCDGSLAEHIESITVISPNGETTVIGPEHELFNQVVGGMGLLGVIVEAKLKLRRVSSGDLEVRGKKCRNWQEQFRSFEEEIAGSADYCVGWVDSFARGASAGRGVVHSARYVVEPRPESLSLEHQEMKPKIGPIRKANVWKLLRLVTNRPMMRVVNWAKFSAAGWEQRKSPYYQPIMQFQFLLDSLPGWERSYSPGRLVQIQLFAPKERAIQVFRHATELQQEARLESFLTVLKRHRPDDAALTWALDGFSLAMDFKVTRVNEGKFRALWQKIALVNLQAGGRFYFAKDSLLDREQAQQYLGNEAISKFQRQKEALDPEGLLTNELARRIGLVE